MKLGFSIFCDHNRNDYKRMIFNYVCISRGLYYQNEKIVHKIEIIKERKGKKRMH